jgi:hypothetical protein
MELGEEVWGFFCFFVRGKGSGSDGAKFHGGAPRLYVLVYEIDGWSLDFIDKIVSYFCIFLD